jgi:hypothetical protein
MHNEKDVDEGQEPPLIRFGKWVLLGEKARSALQYRVAFKREDLGTAEDYLKRKLRYVRTGRNFNQMFQENSKKLREAEEGSHALELIKHAGFKTCPSSPNDKVARRSAPRGRGNVDRNRGDPGRDGRPNRDDLTENGRAATTNNYEN